MTAHEKPRFGRRVGDLLTVDQAIREIERILSRVVCGTFDEGYRFAGYLKSEAQKFHDETADAESVE